MSVRIVGDASMTRQARTASTSDVTARRPP
jgi:hypothetical protein